MLEDFLDGRRDEMAACVWDSPDDSFMKDTDDLAGLMGDGWCIGQLRVFADRRCTVVHHDGDGVTARFLVPFNGPEDAMKEVISWDPDIPECRVADTNDLRKYGYTPACRRNGSYLLFKLVGSHPADPEQFERKFDEWHRTLLPCLKVANAEITEFNESLPAAARKMHADRKQKILGAEGVRAALVGRYQNGGSA